MYVNPDYFMVYTWTTALLMLNIISRLRAGKIRSIWLCGLYLVLATVTTVSVSIAFIGALLSI